ncbi:MAG: PUA domain-containing protein [Fervidobacterium sp.]
MNDGAYNAILKRKSFLPVGITKVEGNFNRGEVVLILYNGKIVGRGISNYSNEEL